jgi:hypothetical protein
MINKIYNNWTNTKIEVGDKNKKLVLNYKSTNVLGNIIGNEDIFTYSRFIVVLLIASGVARSAF